MLEMIFVYLGMGFMLYVCFNNMAEDLININKWKRSYRILFRISLLLLWPAYICLVGIFIILGICYWLFKEIMEMFK